MKDSDEHAVMLEREEKKVERQKLLQQTHQSSGTGSTMEDNLRIASPAVSSQLPGKEPSFSFGKHLSKYHVKRAKIQISKNNIMRPSAKVKLPVYANGLNFF